jgi:hypothetical protein
VDQVDQLGLLGVQARQVLSPARDNPTGHVEVARSAFLLPLNYQTKELGFPEGRGDRGGRIALCHGDHAGALKFPNETVNGNIGALGSQSLKFRKPLPDAFICLQPDRVPAIGGVSGFHISAMRWQPLVESLYEPLMAAID